jgi:hypothetical protein
MDRLLVEKHLLEVCAIQWRTCVQAAEASFQHIPAEQRLTIRYEDLVADPVAVARQVFQHTGLTFTGVCSTFARDHVHGGNLEKWRQRLTADELDLLLPHIEEELRRHGYTVS